MINLLGVRGIENYVTVQAEAIADESVCADIKSTLERQEDLEAAQVTVGMDGGAVRLAGTVPSWNQRCAILTAARFAPGVQQVVDDLKVATALRTA